MADAPPPEMPGDEPSPAPVPPRADLDSLAPPPAPAAPTGPRRRGLLVGIVVAVVAVSTLGAFAVLRSTGELFPERIGGYERMHDSQARSFEDSLEGLTMGDTTIQGAMYGASHSATPALVVEVVSGGDTSTLAAIPIEDFMRGAAGGFEGSGAGTIDVEAGATDTRAGIEYFCAPVELKTPSALSGSQACGWKGADDLGFVFVTGTTSPETGFERTELVYGAVHA